MGKDARPRPGGREWRLGAVLDAALAARPDAGALVVGLEPRTVTYRDLDAEATRLADALLRSGLGRGDVIGLGGASTLEYVVTLVAAARAGLVIAPLDPSLPGEEVAQRLDAVGARVLVVDAPSASSRAVPCPVWTAAVREGAATVNLAADDPPRAAAPPAGLGPEDAMVMFTSGTTGRPKLVPWTHEALATTVAAVADAYHLTGADATVAAMPLFHGHGLVATLLTTLRTGGRLRLPERGRFTAHTFWADAAAVGATWYSAVPTIHEILVERAAGEFPGGDRVRLRFVRSCSAPLAPEAARRVAATFGAPVLGAYGMTEATHHISGATLDLGPDLREGAVGRPVAVEARIAGEDGIGEILLRGPSIARGYLGDAAATAAAFVDGWLRTGDLGALDEHGLLRVTGRIKELINRGGEKVAPGRVEGVLGDDAGVAEAVAFGVPDRVYGERVAAAVVAAPGATLDPEALRSLCRRRLAPFEVPDRILVVPALPHTAKGSVDRREAARRYAG